MTEIDFEKQLGNGIEIEILLMEAQIKISI